MATSTGKRKNPLKTMMVISILLSVATIAIVIFWPQKMQNGKVGRVGVGGTGSGSTTSRSTSSGSSAPTSSFSQADNPNTAPIE